MHVLHGLRGGRLFRVFESLNRQKLRTLITSVNKAPSIKFDRLEQSRTSYLVQISTYYTFCSHIFWSANLTASFRVVANCIPGTNFPCREFDSRARRFVDDGSPRRYRTEKTKLHSDKLVCVVSAEWRRLLQEIIVAKSEWRNCIISVSNCH